MKEKAVWGIAFTLLLVSVLTSAFIIHPVKAELGTIYINADGSVTPATVPISTVDNITYTLTGNITYPTYDGILVQRNNTVIDGNGYTVQGDQSGNGLSLTDVSNVTVKNFNIASFQNGVYLSGSDSSIISGNNATENSYGIYLSSSSSNTIIGNHITNNGEGVWITSSSNISISGNNITENNMAGWVTWGIGINLDASSSNSISGNNITANDLFGIELGSSSNNTISGNTFTDDGLQVGDSYQNSVENNTVNGKPLVYLEGVANYSVGDAGQVILVRCDSISVENLNLSRASVAVQLFETNNTIISQNNITNNDYAIELDYSTNNTVSGNNITANVYLSLASIYLDYSSSNTIIGNNIINNGLGIGLDYSSSNTIIGNNIIGDSGGILLDSSSSNSIIGNSVTSGGSGIGLVYSSNINSLSGNNIAANTGWGSYFESSSYNSVTGNNITNNGLGMYLADSSYSNDIYHNNFINNTVQVSIDESTNVWDDGYPSGGNYWSDYNGTDLYSGPYQNVTGSDGIGDTPYIIDANDIDYYPLMNPYSTNSLSVTISPASSTLDTRQRLLFTSEAQGGTLPYTYQWYLNGTAVPSADFSSWTFTPTSSGSYTVYLNATDSAGAIAISNTATVTVNVAPTVSVAPVGPTTLDVGQSQTFNSTISGGTSPYTYQWYLNGTLVSGAIGSTWTFTPTSAGNYTVYVNATDSVGAQATSNTAVVTAQPVTPEFPSYLILLFFMMTTLLAAFVLKRKRNARTKLSQPSSAFCTFL